MALQCTTSTLLPFSPSTTTKIKASCLLLSRYQQENNRVAFSYKGFPRLPFLTRNFRGIVSEACNDDDPFDMDEEERREMRRKIRQVMEMNPEVDKGVDPVEKKKMMKKLVADYPLVVEEEDPDWPDDADGRGFNFDQFFNKITINNVEEDEKDEEDCDDEGKVVWEDDNYIRPIKDITSAEWEETVFKDISPLVILVHNRYRRPKDNEKARYELEKAVNIIWDCGFPSPRCVAIDAFVERDLVSTLGVSLFPQLIFTKSGKILHREEEIRTADELSKIMAFFYYGAAKPPSLNSVVSSETIPAFPIK